jgi:hypothetical protein
MENLVCTNLADLLASILWELFAFPHLHGANHEPSHVTFFELLVPKYHFLFVPSKLFAASCAVFHVGHVCYCLVLAVIEFCVISAQIAVAKTQVC